MAHRKIYEVVLARAAINDLDALFDFLLASYMYFGDSIESAFTRAEARVERVKFDLRTLGKRPHQGTLRPEIMSGLRSVTKDRAIFYFTVDEDERRVRVLAVFFGGQDHQREMLKRVMSE